MIVCQKGYDEHKQQVQWYIAYKKKSDQMWIKSTIVYSHKSFSLMNNNE